MHRPTTLVAVLLLALAAAACAGTAPAATGAGPVAGAGSLGITAWARASGQVGGVSAAYVTIENRGPAADTLASATSPVAEVVEIHRTTTDGGMMGMHPVNGLAIPAGETVTMAPGGTHLMLIGLASELRPGSTIELVLTFETAGSVTITAEVRAS